MIPQQGQLLFPLTTAIAEAGGSIRAKTAADSIAETINLPTEERDACATTPGGKKYNVWDRQIRWVQQLGKLRGLTANDGDGVWRLTESAEDKLENIRPGIVVTIWENSLGVVLWAQAEAVERRLDDRSVNTIVTSPPYELTRKKAYDEGRSEAEHVRWLAGIIGTWKRVLAEDGSLFLNLGDVWLPGAGAGTQSLYQERLLLELVDRMGYHLVQKLAWENPSKLPAPAEYVTVRRVRVNPSLENFWWLAPSTSPKANNRNVQVPYSAAMLKTLARGTNAGTRPSGHVVGEHAFSQDNGGAIPHALITAPNSASNTTYLQRCRAAGIEPHPARFPEALPEFAIKLTTDPGDVVADFFGGSLTTAATAQRLGRRFITCDRSRHYLDGGILQLAA
jgi:site-specific DNA-methyltransferase (cytosine-N4-specific)